MADYPRKTTLHDRLAAAARETPRGVHEAAFVERWLGPPPPPYDTYLRLGLGIRAAAYAFSSADHPERIRQDRFPHQ